MTRSRNCMDMNLRHRLSQPLGSSKPRQIEEEYLKQLIYLLIWKRMEREMLDKYSGLIPQFVRQLDSYTSSFDKVFQIIEGKNGERE